MNPSLIEHYWPALVTALIAIGCVVAAATLGVGTTGTLLVAGGWLCATVNSAVVGRTRYEIDRLKRERR